MKSAAVWILLAVVSAAIGAEVVAWSGRLQRWLLRRASLALPATLRARYLEEWLAELQAVAEGPVTRLLWVSSIFLRRYSLARALGANIGGLAIKRSVDIAVSGSALVLLLPLLFVFGVITRSRSSHAFYRQLRVGPDGQPFAMLRFALTHGRTGKVSSFGRFLRQFGLDDLPQLINVLKGDMSVVGPPPNLRLPDGQAPPVDAGKAGLIGMGLVPCDGQHSRGRGD